MMLVGDIGGTNTRLALAVHGDAGWQLTQLRRFDTPADLPALLRHYLHHIEPLAAALQGAAFCGAGPRRDDGSIALTNHPCVMMPAELAAAAGLPNATVVNDFEAVAQAVPDLVETDLRACGGSTAGDADAPRLVLGPGTGLGLASLVPIGRQWRVLAGEGGHADLAPVADDELAVWQTIRSRHGALSAESLLSGSGLGRLHEAISGQTLAAPDITAAARAADAMALRTARLFTRWLGRVAANAALTLGARGGVYLAGGIVPGWGELFDVATFREGFEDKTTHRAWLTAIPAWIITHPQPALIGLARLARPAQISA